MVKKNGSVSGCWCGGVSSKKFAITMILIGVAYVLQHNGILFSNIVLWPWVLIALGICTYLCK